MSVVEERLSVADFRDVFQRIQTEVGKVMVGQDEVVEEVLISCSGGRARVAGGSSGTGKDDARPYAGGFARSFIQPHTVHS